MTFTRSASFIQIVAVLHLDGLQCIHILSDLRQRIPESHIPDRSKTPNGETDPGSIFKYFIRRSD